MERIKKCLTILMCSLVMVIPAHARDKGKITIQLLDDLKQEEVMIGINQVATLNNGEFVFNEKYQDCNIDIGLIKTANDLANAAKILSELQVASDYTISTDQSGKAEIAKLDLGLYLINASTASGSEEIVPTLVAVPHYEKTKEDYIYDITLSLKHQPKVIATGDQSDLYLVGITFMAAIFGIGILLKRKIETR